jgi:hypothetical protein
MSITQTETPPAQPQVTAAPTLDAAVADMINAVNAYVAAVDMLLLNGPQRRQVDQNSPVFRALAGAVQQLQTATKSIDETERASTIMNNESMT